MQRYFAKQKEDNNFILEDSDIHHIKNVMRNKINDIIEIVYDKKVYPATIKSISPLLLEIGKPYTEDREINLDLTIAVGLVGEQKFDLILQKLTELGVSTIIPVKMSRSIVKLDEKKYERKLERWHTICKEASEQSHRLIIPKVLKPITLKELLAYKAEQNLICSLNDNTLPLEEYLKKDLNSILFLIGPEGGITNEEEKFLTENGFKSTTLGKRILRVETATMCVASIINYVYKG